MSQLNDSFRDIPSPDLFDHPDSVLPGQVKSVPAHKQVGDIVSNQKDHWRPQAIRQGKDNRQRCTKGPEGSPEKSIAHRGERDHGSSFEIPYGFERYYPLVSLNLHLNNGSKDGPCHVWMRVEQLQVPLACIVELPSIVPIDPFERRKHGLQKSKVLHALDVPRGLEKKGSQ